MLTDGRGCHPALTGFDEGATKKQLISHFTNFAEPVLRVLDRAPEDSIKLWDLLDMELQPTIIRGNALLIGDAAHPFLPRGSHIN